MLAERFPGARLGEAANIAEAAAQLQTCAWDLVLLDLAMPGGSGLDLLRKMRNEPKPPVLVLSMYPEEQYAIPVLRAGGAGYVNKAAAPGELLAAIERVLGGGKHVSAYVTELLVSDLAGKNERARHELLSSRELQVLRGLASGKTVSDLARELARSAKTVSTFRSRILRKMAMKTNSELTRYAIQHGLIE